MLLVLICLPAAAFWIRGRRAFGHSEPRQEIASAFTLGSLLLTVPPVYVFASGLIGRVPVGEYRMLQFLISLGPLWVAHFLLLSTSFVISRTVETLPDSLAEFLWRQGKNLWFQGFGLLLPVAGLTALQVGYKIVAREYEPNQTVLTLVTFLILAVTTWASAAGLLRLRKGITDLQPLPDIVQQKVRVLTSALNLSPPPKVGLAANLRMAVFAQGIFSPTVVLTHDVVGGLPLDCLSALIAHELAHIRLRHLLKRSLIGGAGACAWLGGILAMRTVLGLPLNWVLGLLLGMPLGLVLWLQWLSRRQEYEADALAVRTIGESGPLIQGLIWLEEITAPLGVQSSSRLNNLFSGHPSVQERVSRLTSQVDTARGQENRARRIGQAGAISKQ